MRPRDGAALRSARMTAARAHDRLARPSGQADQAHRGLANPALPAAARLAGWQLDDAPLGRSNHVRGRALPQRAASDRGQPRRATRLQAPILHLCAEAGLGGLDLAQLTLVKANRLRSTRVRSGYARPRLSRSRRHRTGKEHFSQGAFRQSMMASCRRSSCPGRARYRECVRPSPAACGRNRARRHWAKAPAPVAPGGAGSSTRCCK